MTLGVLLHSTEAGRPNFLMGTDIKSHWSLVIVVAKRGYSSDSLINIVQAIYTSFLGRLLVLILSAHYSPLTHIWATWVLCFPFGDKMQSRVSFPMSFWSLRKEAMLPSIYFMVMLASLLNMVLWVHMPFPTFRISRTRRICLGLGGIYLRQQWKIVTHLVYTASCQRILRIECNFVSGQCHLQKRIY